MHGSQLMACMGSKLSATFRLEFGRGWGSGDLWSRRRTVLDLIVLTYFDPLKEALMRPCRPAHCQLRCWCVNLGPSESWYTKVTKVHYIRGRAWQDQASTCSRTLGFPMAPKIGPVHYVLVAPRRKCRIFCEPSTHAFYKHRAHFKHWLCWR